MNSEPASNLGRVSDHIVINSFGAFQKYFADEFNNLAINSLIVLNRDPQTVDLTNILNVSEALAANLSSEKDAIEIFVQSCPDITAAEKLNKLSVLYEKTKSIQKVLNTCRDTYQQMIEMCHSSGFISSDCINFEELDGQINTLI